MSKKGRDPVNSAIFTFGTKMLEEAGVQGARAMIGNWYQEYEKEDLLDAIVSAEKNKAVSPLLYIQKILSGRSKKQKIKKMPEVIEKKPLLEGKDLQWSQRIKHWRNTGFWPISFGPKPGEIGCQCPRELISSRNSIGN